MTSLVSRDAPRQQGHLLPTPGSCSSIDLNSVLLGSGSLDNLLSYPLLLPSCTSGSLSLRDVPPFPAHAVPPLFLNAFEDLPRKRPVDPKWTSNAVITIPTSPRLRNTMMEAICIDWWRSNVSGSPPPADIGPDEPGVLREIAWKPEGSVVLPERFRRIRDECSPCDVSRLSNIQFGIQGRNPELVYENTGKETGLLAGHVRPMIQVQVEEIQDDGRRDFGAEGKHAVPTIMVSNSTAIVPLSLESSQSLASAPLALRRGQKMLPPITVPPSARLVTPASSYPDIPSPFLGSPSSSRPLFEPSNGELRGPSEDLEHICTDLYARLPSVCLPPLSPALETPQLAGVAHQQAPGIDAEDDWAGPQEFVDLHASTIPQLFRSTPPKTSLPTSPGTGSWGGTPTLVDTTQDSTPSTADSPETMGFDTKKQRRKTVIIETSPTPQRISSPLAVPDSDKPTEEQDPIPFETPEGHLVSCSACHTSMLAPSRPVSTASMRPVRGILKGKKSVRFSTVPECVVVGDDAAPKEAARPRSGSVPPAAKPLASSARRASVAPAPPPSPASPKTENESTSWPRHPALRAMARHTADLSVPKPQAQTPPVMAGAERRSPLRSINLRQSLPVKRNSTAVHHDKVARKSIAVGDIGPPRRLMKTASAPVPARPSVAKVDIENVAVKGEIVKPKSRMPVPLRGIFAFPRLRS